MPRGKPLLGRIAKPPGRRIAEHRVRADALQVAQILDTLIALHESVLASFIAHRAALSPAVLPSIPHGMLDAFLVDVLDHATLPLTPSHIADIIVATGWHITNKTVATTLIQLRRRGLAEQVARGWWRRPGSET